MCIKKKKFSKNLQNNYFQKIHQKLERSSFFVFLKPTYISTIIGSREFRAFEIFGATGLQMWLRVKTSRFELDWTDRKVDQLCGKSCSGEILWNIFFFFFFLIREVTALCRFDSFSKKRKFGQRNVFSVWPTMIASRIMHCRKTENLGNNRDTFILIFKLEI